MSDRAIGALIRTRRLAAGLTQEALAHWAGIRAATLSEIETGRRLAHRATQRAIEAALRRVERERGALAERRP